ncbi:MAG: TRAP-type transporter substrate-binding component [Saliniramus fredricksonii]|uniref:TRAP-type C4-dicarboxylate transport system, substrate-binding protein n=1 Tax=Saliniramus fredricksonii TaxID=1653334 RepID=A0A0P8AC14_9HYPH|nr:TRAP transporter substrate-binding protein [Saliniramus fredricksonii]KPQ12828.1 MAG: TRAP-type transporter substrate-binding component [Saliniramus fredricksonii]SCC82497.1 TRAP-type C4-dicarboxylate transport system, substrate-binding protein [Saliniramus fredricksonii]
MLHTLKKTIPAATVAGLFALGALGVSDAQAQQIEIHNTMSAGGSEEAALQRFQEIIAERSDGRLGVDIYLGGQLGNETDVLQLLSLGQTQMALTGGAFMGEYAADYDAVSVPFVFPSWDAVEHYIMETESGEALQAAALERGNLVYLGPQMRAFRHMTSAKPINSPDDLDGLTMRLPQIPVWVDVWEELGVQAVVIPAPDIYLAMRTGQVEAHENSLASPYTRQMWEVQDYIITTAHLSFPWHWVASASWWDGLSEDDRAMVLEAVEEARQHGIAVEMERDEYYREALIERGMEFIDVDQGPFREKAAPAVERALADKADSVMGDIDAAIAATQ